MKGPNRHMRTEQQALKVSLAPILLVSVLGIGFGLVSGSFAILFDGVFSLMDAVMSVVSLTVAGLISRSVANRLSVRTQNAFTMGFWHFEPIVLLVNSVLMMGGGRVRALPSGLGALSGGREVDFGPAVVYAAVVVVITVVMGVLEHRANRRIGSEFVAMDVKGWIMAGGVTGALLIAFVIGMIIDGTEAEWFMPYVDPAVLTVVALVLIPVPFSTAAQGTVRSLARHPSRTAGRTPRRSLRTSVPPKDSTTTGSMPRHRDGPERSRSSSTCPRACRRGHLRTGTASATPSKAASAGTIPMRGSPCPSPRRTLRPFRRKTAAGASLRGRATAMRERPRRDAASPHLHKRR